MTLSPIWRDRIWMSAAAAMAVTLGFYIADESFFWPSLLVGLVSGIAIVQIQPIKLSAILIGLAVLGYIVGNRGFAQISLARSIPILPAEFVLLVAGSILVVRCALERSLPLLRETLNVALFIWIGISSIRILPDLRAYGVMALRDFATVYYAAFFFMVQDFARRERERTFLYWCFLSGFGALVIVVPFYQLFPDFFLGTLTFRGIPVIFFKGDLEGTFAAAGSVLFFARFERSKSRLSLAICLLLAGLTLESNNRASMVGLAVATLLLAAAGQRKLAYTLGAAAVAGTVVFLAAALIRNRSWTETPVYGVYERVESLTDPYGQQTFTSDASYNKGDNNAFRTTWWKIIIGETLSTNPWFGMGWGNDLAEPFVRVYYPEGGEDFGVRSPHDIFVTLFARTGIVGILPFLVFVAAFGIRSFRAIRLGYKSAYLWATGWTILVSAAFGVVLEGPMGAVVFWSLLGLASSYDIAEVEATIQAL